MAEISDPTALRGHSRLWLLSPAAARQLTFAELLQTEDETDPSWAYDGRHILYLAKRSTVTMLLRRAFAAGQVQSPETLVMADGGGSRVRMTWVAAGATADVSVKGYASSPDGKYLALWNNPAPGADAQKTRPVLDDAYVHGAAAAGDMLTIFDVDRHVGTRIALNGLVEHLTWSASGGDLIVSTQTVSATGPITMIWRVAPGDASATKIDLPSNASTAAYLPGRKAIAYTAQCADDSPPLLCQDLFIKDLASGLTRNVTHGFNGSLVGNFIVAENGDLVILAASKMLTRIARISPTDGAITWIDTGRPVAVSVATNARQSAWAAASTGSTDSGSVLLSSRLGGQAVAVKLPPLAPAAWPRVPSRLIEWNNQGLKIEGLLYLPRAARGSKVPLIVHIHGGPGWRFEDAYSPLVQLLVAQGWAVLQPNIRGSTGYGTAFLAANKNDLGGGDYQDIISGVDKVITDYPIDPKRLALIGYSYGGEMAGFAAGKTARFRALVAGGPVTDQISEFGTETWSLTDQWYFGEPVRHLADAWRQSPLAYANSVKTPLLLFHGKEDATDPLGQSLEFWRALKMNGFPVQLVVYPRESHVDLYYNFVGLPSNEPWHGFDLRQRMIGFIWNIFLGVSDSFAVSRPYKNAVAVDHRPAT